VFAKGGAEESKQRIRPLILQKAELVGPVNRGEDRASKQKGNGRELLQNLKSIERFRKKKRGRGRSDELWVSVENRHPRRAKKMKSLQKYPDGERRLRGGQTRPEETPGSYHYATQELWKQHELVAWAEVDRKGNNG